MISFEETDTLQAFAEKYNLLNHSDLFVLHDKDLKFEKIFGDCPFPTSFIYNKEGNLVKHFKGEVKIETLLKYLNE